MASPSDQYVASCATDGKNSGDGEDLMGGRTCHQTKVVRKEVWPLVATDGPAQHKMERLGIRDNFEYRI